MNKHRIIYKLKNQKGESISEVLVALLIAVLAGVMLAAMIAAATNVTAKSEAAFDDYYSKTNDMMAQSGTSGTVTISGTITGTSTNISDSVPVNVYSGPEIGGSTIYRYEAIND